MTLFKYSSMITKHAFRVISTTYAQEQNDSLKIIEKTLDLFYFEVQSGHGNNN